METANQQKHFVLVHGACHGAWCWFKLIPLLESAGHRVSAFDLAASGLDKREIEEVPTIYDYTKPLLDFMENEVSPEEKVILVGHSLGGMNLALAMEEFPEKISVAVFLSAFMPDSVHAPSYVLDQYNEVTPSESWLDTKFKPYDSSNEDSETSMFFGPKFAASKLYQLSSPEDLELAKILMRPSSLFLKSLSSGNKFTEQGYGSVKRVSIVGEQDIAIPKEFQFWMIKNSPVSEVKVIKPADHMSMFSNPQAIYLSLIDIALKYV